MITTSMNVISKPSNAMNWSLKGSIEDAEEMEKIFRFLGTPFEDDARLLILHFNHYKV